MVRSPRHRSDPTGVLATFQPNGATLTANNAFFQNLGTNGRTCFWSGMLWPEQATFLTRPPQCIIRRPRHRTAVIGVARRPVVHANQTVAL
jgi:hypothetical protein